MFIYFSNEVVSRTTSSCHWIPSPSTAQIKSPLFTGTMVAPKGGSGVRLHSSRVTYLKCDWRDEGTPVGRLRALMQQGLDLRTAMMSQRVIGMQNQGLGHSWCKEGTKDRSKRRWRNL